MRACRLPLFAVVAQAFLLFIHHRVIDNLALSRVEVAAIPEAASIQWIVTLRWPVTCTTFVRALGGLLASRVHIAW